MSPSRRKGSAVDKRSDIWAFGCVLYEMLTGRARSAARTSRHARGRVGRRAGLDIAVARSAARDPNSGDGLPREGSPEKDRRGVRRPVSVFCDPSDSVCYRWPAAANGCLAARPTLPATHEARLRRGIFLICLAVAFAILAYFTPRSIFLPASIVLAAIGAGNRIYYFVGKRASVDSSAKALDLRSPWRVWVPLTDTEARQENRGLTPGATLRQPGGRLFHHGTDARLSAGRYLFVHGIGTQPWGDTLGRRGDALVKTIGRGTRSNAQVIVERAGPSEDSATKPAEAHLTVESDHHRERWLLSESWWAESFPQPTYRELVSWSLRALPWAVALHFARGYWREAAANRKYAIPLAFIRASSKLLVMLLFTPVIMLLMGLSLVIGALPPLRGWVSCHAVRAHLHDGRHARVRGEPGPRRPDPERESSSR